MIKPLGKDQPSSYYNADTTINTTYWYQDYNTFCYWGLMYLLCRLIRIQRLRSSTVLIGCYDDETLWTKNAIGKTYQKYSVGYCVYGMYLDYNCTLVDLGIPTVLHIYVLYCCVQSRSIEVHTASFLQEFLYIRNFLALQDILLFFFLAHVLCICG